MFPVTLGFFDDILIPVNALQHPSQFDETEQAWVWKYPVGDGEAHDLFMDAGKIHITNNVFSFTSLIIFSSGNRPLRILDGSHPSEGDGSS